MDVDKLKAILAALQGTDVTRITWSEGQETIDLRLGHPPAPTTAVHAVPVATAPIAAAMNTATPPSVSPVPAAAAAPAPAASAANNSFTVDSPFVGTFYRSA